MAYKQLISDIDLFVSTHRHDVTERREDYIKFNTKLLSVIYCYDNLEYVSTLFVGSRTGNVYTEICEDVINDCFPTVGVSEQLDISKQLDSIINYLEEEPNRINELEKYTEKKSEEYTRELLESQKYTGMTVNERLYESGLMYEFDKAVIKKNKQVLRHILGQLNLDDEDIERIVSQVI